MEVRVAVLADAANIAEAGKLNILGVFDTVQAVSFPAVQPAMVLALRYRVGYEDARKSHTLGVAFRDEDGREIGRAAAQVIIGEIEPGRFAHGNEILRFAGVQFAKPGHYVFEITWDGQAVAPVDLLVEEMKGQKG
jgi:hypothetical protein